MSEGRFRAVEQPTNVEQVDDVSAPIGKFAPVGTNDLSVSQADLDFNNADENVGALENFTNAFQKSLISGTQSDLSELLGRHEEAVVITNKANKDLPTVGGVSEFLGNAIGSVAPVAATLIFPALSIPLFTYFGARAMGQGRGAVRSFEDISGEDVSGTDEALVSAGYGLAVLATERLGLGSLKGVANKLAPASLKKIMGAYATGSSKATAKTMITEFTKVTGTGAVKEGGQEGLEQSLTNLIDTYYGAKDINDLLTGVPEAIAMGVVGGGLIGGASLAVQSKNTRKELSKVGVQRDLQNTNPNMGEDEITHVGKVINSFADAREVTPKEQLAIIDGTDAGMKQLRNDMHLMQRTAQKGTVDSFVSNSMPLFKHAASATAFGELETFAGVESGAKWKNKQSKKFRDEFEKFINGEETSSDSPTEAFEQYQRWMGNLSAHTFETGFFEGAKDRTIAFIDEVHGSSEVHDNSPFNREQITKRKQFNKDWNETLVDMVDTRAVFERVDAPLTGDALTNLASVQDLIQEKTEGTAQSMAKSLQQNGFVGDEFKVMRQQLPLILEDTKVFDTLPSEMQIRLKPVVNIWNKYRDDALASYKEEGALEQGFFEDMRDRLAEQKMKAGRKGDQALLDKIDTQLSEVSTGQFVPIPYRAWFESMLSNNPKRLHKILKVQGTKKRKTLFIRDLIKKGAIKANEVDMFQILGYYGNRLAKDIGILKLNTAGTSEGMIKDLKKGDKPDVRGGFTRAPKSAPMLRGKQIRAPLGDAINEVTKYRNEMSIVDKGLAMTKMGQFINPLFLPVYDAVQAAMLGSINPLHPIKTFKNIKKASNDMRTQSDAWYEAGMNGTRSTPYAKPTENFEKQIQNIAEHPNSTVRSLKGIFSKDVLRSAYDTSWKIAWTLDGFVRQISYRHLTDDLGYSPKEAGRIAALYHADYAGVPAKTRKTLNRIFFTPTFKIAMSKLFTRMIKDSMSVSLKSGKLLGQKVTGQRPNVKFNKAEKLHAVSLGRTIGIIMGMDMLMTSFLGFDRDQWGRRYVKKDVETSTGQKDVVFTMSNPANMFLKYTARIKESFFDPAVTKPFNEFAKKNSWELHPVWRMAMGLANNEKSNGEMIVPTLANKRTKISRYSNYVMRESLALVDEIATSVSGQTDEAETRRVLQEELGKFAEFSTRMFVFAYLRTSGETKQARQIKKIEAVMKSEMSKIIDAQGNFSPVLQEEIIENTIKRLNEIVK